MKTNRFRIHYAIFSLLNLFALLLGMMPARAQVRPVYDLGAIGLGQMLKRLQTTASAMHTGAHPDDEDSGLLAYLARREQARTVYLALNRGDGGQNVIGEELFEPLGVIRTEELRQARRLDGGAQMFTRVMDYGFSKKREEAARIWGEQLTLGDMVRAIRLFRPLVIISRFAGTPADGHGQHQLAGYLTPIAFKAAADPKMFPEQLAEGLQPWQAKKLYVSQSFQANPNNVPTLSIDTGEYDSLIGRSYFEIAMEGRSQHKSQEMGMLELRGKQMSGMRLVESLGTKVEKETGVFDGLDTSIKGIAALTNNAEEPFSKKLAELQETAETALKSYDPLAPQKLVPILAKGYKQAYDAEWSTRNPDSKILLQQKEAEFAKAMQLAAGVVLDALSDTDTLVPGDATNVAVRVFAPENADLKVTGVTLRTPKGWTSEGAAEQTQPENGFRPRRENAFSASFFKLTSPRDARPTEPYWLENPRSPNFTFDWSAPDAAKNLPFQPPLVTAEIRMTIGGQEITAEREVEYRYSDDIRGEIRRELNLVPALSVSLDQKILIVPMATKPQKKRIVMSLTNNSPRPISGTVSLNSNSATEIKYTSSAPTFALRTRGEKTAIAFDVEIPAKTKPEEYEIYGQAMVGEGLFTNEMQTIAYPHIQTHRIYTRAETKVRVLDLQVAPVKVGYIMGSGDRVPQAIRRLGLDVTMLDEKELSTGDLSRFDTIVVGIRASQVRPDFVANNERLNDYVKNGGTLIVQYQQSEYIRLNLPPLPAKMDTNIRTVEENAPVKILQPGNPVFTFPNRITDADFNGWVQERDLYTFTSFDPKYVPLLETHDEGEPESTGGMLYAEIGKGRYIYTAFSWFRQLPVGNPGAYRIFANLLSLPKAPKTQSSSGVPECDDYLNGYEACLSIIGGKSPKIQSGLMTAFESQRQSIRQAAANPKSKTGLASTCRQALDTAKQATAFYSCPW
ncbi:MAG: PIG-L family deacetylase [Acidobacteria bacterium]|nr:PIG-L family deacetylase [Acidobacteriota bacterium]